MAAYCQVYGVIHFTSPAGWLPVHRDQLRAQHSVTSVGKLYLYRLLQLVLHLCFTNSPSYCRFLLLFNRAQKCYNLPWFPLSLTRFSEVGRHTLTRPTQWLWLGKYLLAGWSSESETFEFKDFQGPFQRLFKGNCTYTLQYTARLYAATISHWNRLLTLTNTTMLQEFTVTRRKGQINSLPFSNQNFPKPTNDIPGLFKDFQGLPSFSKPWICSL